MNFTPYTSKLYASSPNGIKKDNAYLIFNLPIKYYNGVETKFSIVDNKVLKKKKNRAH